LRSFRVRATLARAMTTMTDHAFDADTAVEPAGDGRYAARLTDRWNALGGTPNGGYMLAVCLRALAAEMPLPDPLVASAYFLRPGAVGPAEVRTEVIRSGRRTATGESTLRQDGREIVRLVSTFGDLEQAAGRTAGFDAAPELPPPDEASDALSGGSMPGVSIVDQLEYRTSKPLGWPRGEPTGDPRLEFWMRFRDGREPDPLALAALVDAAAPAVLELGVPGSATLELTVHVRRRPAPGWLACRVATRHVIDGYHEEDFEIWDSQGRLVAQSRQFALLPG
jgi:acyl-CoA thioesterase